MKRRKRYIALLAAIAVTISMASASLAQSWLFISIEQCYAVMPQIDVYFTLQDGDGNAVDPAVTPIQEVSASLGSKKLAIDFLEPFSDATTYFFIVDISDSIPDKLFEQIKSELLAWIDQMSDADCFVLITMGETASIALDGTESREVAKNTVSALEARDRYTVFHESLAKAIEIAQSSGSYMSQRRICLVVTDGINATSTEGGTSFSELSESLKAATLPLFALGVGSDEKALSALGELTRASGGIYKQTSSETLTRDFEALQTHINRCYHLRLRAESNIISGQTETLSMKLTFSDGSAVDTTTGVTVTRWIPDGDVPLASVEAGPENKVIKITFSEAVDGAGAAENYTLRDEKGTVIPLDSAIYNSSDNVAELIPSAVLNNGAYSLELHGITDISMEKNAAAFAGGTSVTIQLTNGVDEEAVGAQTLAGAPLFWWVIAVAFVLTIIIAIVIYSASRGKRTDEKQKAIGSALDTDIYDEQIHLKKQDGVHITLSILDGKGLQRNISVFVASNLVIGRSASQCDVSIEDRLLSRQHCAFVYQNDMLLVQDLDSTNGTFLNGSRLVGSRAISDGDTVCIGSNKIAVSMQ